MADIMTPALGESVTEATVARWTKKAGDAVRKDEILVELETDKVSLEVAAPADGVLSEILAGEGDTVEPGTVLGKMSEGGAAAAPAKAEAPKAEAKPEPKAEAAPAPAPAKSEAAKPAAPSAQRIATENNLDLAKVSGSGKDGRVTKGDAIAALESRASAPAPAAAPSAPRELHEREERVRMTRLRQTIARRLKEAQNNAAMLTTFNEVDMSAVMALRTEYKDVFEKRHGVRLGFMSFFVKACIAALKQVPDVNAEIDGQD
ncbi:MAG: biotin/lipoyl-containing protein, partial [Phenylobacterium sp.]|nr:biotin/lipoyl-containing protein [Phenylobacterium sp.]